MSADYASYMGKTLLVGITYVNAHDEAVEQKQSFGTIIEIDESKIAYETSSGERVSIPPMFENIKLAPPGSYKLRSSGVIIENPDFISSWVCRRPEDQ